MRRIKRILVALTTLLLLCVNMGALASPVVYAQSAPTPTNGLIDSSCNVPNASNTEFCRQHVVKEVNPIAGQGGILTKVLRVLTFVAGVAAVVVVIIGGFEYIISGGDSNKINQAKNTILYALIGLVIAISAGAILNFVVGRL